MLIIVAVIWLLSFLLISVARPIFGICGEFGFDRTSGKCVLIDCDNCNGSQDSESGFCPPGGIINTIGVGIPFLIILVSYTIVFVKLRTYSDDDGETNQYKISTIVLTCCYFVFILPIFMVEWIPPKTDDKVSCTFYYFKKIFLSQLIFHRH